jgi:hypothetical protein
MAFWKNAAQSRKSAIVARADVNEEGNLIEVENSSGTNLVTIDGDGDIVTSGDVTAASLSGVGRSITGVRPLNGRHFYAGPNSAPLRFKHNKFSVFPTDGVDTWCSICVGEDAISMRVNGTLSANDTPTRTTGEPGTDWAKNMAATGDYMEYCFAHWPLKVTGHGALDPFVFTVGTSTEAIEIRLKARGDASVFTQLMVGFRNGVAVPTNLTSFTDFAGLSGASGTINAVQRLNSGTQTTTDTTGTITDGDEFELKVRLNVNGTVSYWIDGTAYTGAPAHVFDTGDELFPCIYFEGASGVGSDMFVEEIEVVYSDDIA